MDRDEWPETPENALLIDPSVLCDEHAEALQSWDIPVIPNGVIETIRACTGRREFFAVAFRAKNGYEMPGEMAMDEVPESERPGNAHINTAIRELSPLCCWFEERAEYEEPGADIDPYIHALARHKAEVDDADE